MRFSDISGVKVLGRAIGGASSVVKPSEFDGDGDGFVMGRDGRDNVPVVARAVVDAAKRGGVADILKPTDDLMEVRRSGRPWAPLLMEHQPKEWLDEYKKLTNDVVEEMFARGKKHNEVTAEWKKKYGWDGQLTPESTKNIPQDVIDANMKYLTAGQNFSTSWGDDDWLKRIDDIGKKHEKYKSDKFEEARAAAYAAGKGAKFEKDFEKLNYRGSVVGGKLGPGLRLHSVAFMAFSVGKGWFGDDYKVTDQFKVAEKAAKDAVSNPNKRIVIHVDEKMLETIFRDRKLKNFFQSKRNMFIDDYNAMASYDKWGAADRKRTYMSVRLGVEQSTMGIPTYGFEGKNRPIYAMFMPDGVVSPQAVKGEQGLYGGIGLVMKHDVESRSTFTAGDSANSNYFGASPINDPGMGFGMLGKSMFSAEGKDDINKSLAGGGYAEAQIFGGVSVNDIAYVNVATDTELSPSILETLRNLNIPVVKHQDNKVPYAEPDELKVKADTLSEGFVLFATRNNDKLFVPNKKPKEDDYSGMVSLNGGKAKPVENVLSILNFGYWELV